MKFNPLSNNVLVRIKAQEQTTKMGLFVPVTNQRTLATIIEVGPGRLLDSGQRASMSVKTGDLVILNKGVGEVIQIEQEEFIVVAEEDILGTLNA